MGLVGICAPQRELALNVCGRQGLRARLGPWYDKGMSTIKVAFTIQSGTLVLAKKAVKRGRAKSLSAFVNDALEEKVERDQLTEILDRMDLEYGKPSKADRAWAKRVLSR